MTVEIENIESMSQEELEKLEDQLAENDAKENEPGGDEEAKPQEETLADASTKQPVKVEGEDSGKPGGQSGNDDEANHVSPPSKWIKQRHEARELREKAAKADTLEQELAQTKSQLAFMEETLSKRGIDLPKDPAELLSDERIEEVRDEYGDELADMFKATAALLTNRSAPATNSGGANDAQQQAAANQVDPDLLDAIDNNDELAYWRENSPPLWDKAVAKDTEMLDDPEYAKLSYPERFAKVVQAVKDDVTSSATKQDADKSGDNMPPAASMSGSPGTATTINNDSALDRVLAETDPAKQLAMYNQLPQSQKDEVDKALGI